MIWLKRCLAALAVVSMFAVSFTATTVWQASQSFDLPRSATHQLKGAFGSGSGVMVGPGLMLTAAHIAVLPNLTLNGKPVEVIASDETLDIALLSVQQGCPCAPLAAESPLSDRSVVLVGYPLDVGKVVTEGRWQFFFDNKALTTAPVFFGNSGGGAFQWSWSHQQWELVGILVAVSGGSIGGMFPVVATHLSHIVPVEVIYKWIHVDARD